MDSRKFQHFSSHMPALLHVLHMTPGPVLELGSGFFSTPLIHYYCVARGRQVTTVDNDEKWLQKFSSFEHALHRLVHTADWAIPDLVHEWDVVFIDHGPREQRRVDLLRFADLAKFIVVHDANGRTDRHYHLRELWPQFKHVAAYGKFYPQTNVVSNFYPIGEIC